MDGHQLKLRYHNKLLSSEHVRPFDPERHSPLIDQIKRGRFHQSATALSLYCTSTSRRSMFPEDSAPFGYLHRKEGELMGIGIFRRFDKADYGCIIPLHAGPEAIDRLARWMIRKMELAGVYVRYLPYEEWGALTHRFGFIPPRLHPWNPDAPQEDETHNYSLISLDAFARPTGLIDSKSVRQLFSRSERFLQRNGIRYVLTPLEGELETAMALIQEHYRFLGLSGKLVGSSAQDYRMMMSPRILSSPSVRSYLGILENPDMRTRTPVSLFICDDVGCDTTAIYAGITLRDKEHFKLNPLDSERIPGTLWREESSGTMRIPLPRSLMERPLASADTSLSLSYPSQSDADEMPESSRGFDQKGFSAFSLYAFSRLLLLLREEPDPPRVVHVGGSETHQLNKWKRDMGAELDPSFWALLLSGRMTYPPDRY